jgi:1,4-dihydroxy-6-naphthoate synthase
MTELTLGISPCPNDVFIFSGLLLGEVDSGPLRFHVDYQDVETLNERAQQGALDVVKISYANYLRCAARYALLPCGGALGRGVGPLLLSNGGAWAPDREVLVPGAYTTANFLLDTYARDTCVHRPLQKRFLPFDALYHELCVTPGAQGVVIHEKRFTYEQDGLSLIEDLGSHWERSTGCAIPLGAIVARRSLQRDAALTELIRASLRWAYAHYAEAFALCREHAQDLSAGVVEAHIGLYVNDYSDTLGPEGEAAVDRFLEMQAGFLEDQDANRLL